MSEEILADAIGAHFRRHHQIPHGISEEVFQKWASKMSAGLAALCLRFKRLYSVSPKSSKCKILTRMKTSLSEKLGSKSDLEGEPENKEEPDASELLDDEISPWSLLDRLVSARVAKSGKPAPSQAGEVKQEASAMGFQETAAAEKLGQLALPPEARSCLQTAALP